MSKPNKSIKEGFEKRTVYSNPKPATQKPKPDSNKPPSRPSDDSGQRNSRRSSRND
jgi:hypothetical protein